MTHFNTARINEMLGLQLGVIRDIALRLDGDDLERLEINLTAMEDAIKNLRSMVEGLPHRHQA
jgi:Cu/Ag efflux pump CusA